MFATHAGLVGDVADTDCLAHKGSNCGCVLATAKCKFVMSRTRSQVTGCCLFVIPLLLIVPVMLNWVPFQKVPLNCIRFNTSGTARRKKTVVEHCVCVRACVCVCVCTYVQ